MTLFSIKVVVFGLGTSNPAVVEDCCIVREEPIAFTGESADYSTINHRQNQNH